MIRNMQNDKLNINEVRQYINQIFSTDKCYITYSHTTNKLTLQIDYKDINKNEIEKKIFNFLLKKHTIDYLENDAADYNSCFIEIENYISENEVNVIKSFMMNYEELVMEYLTIWINSNNGFYGDELCFVNSFEDFNKSDDYSALEKYINCDILPLNIYKIQSERFNDTSFRHFVSFYFEF